MWRYLKAAFWARADLPAVGPLPLNALAVFGFGILGGRGARRLAAGRRVGNGLSLPLATNPRFQKVVIAREQWQARQNTEQGRRDLLARLPPESRAKGGTAGGQNPPRHRSQRPDADGRPAGREQPATRWKNWASCTCACSESNKICGRPSSRPTRRLWPGRPPRWSRSCSAGGATLSAALRESKQATLELTQKRLANARRRAESLAEVGSDLARIEAQVELALEDASLEGSRPWWPAI